MDGSRTTPEEFRDIKHISENPSIGETMQSIYEQLATQEKTKSDRNTIIHVGKITPDSQDWKRLTERHIDEDLIASGQIPRGVLLDAGFVFLNKISRGEKPIFNTTIDVGDIKDVNLGDLHLLTEAELEAVKEFQASHPGIFGSNNIPVETIRKDMLSYILAGEYSTGEGPYFGHVNAFRVAAWDIKYEPLFTSLDKRIVREWLNGAIVSTNMEEQIKNEESFMKSHMKDLYPWRDEQDADKTTARGIPIVGRIKGLAGRMVRGKTIKGEPSPFLDSGFTFGQNPDLTLHIENIGTVRINMVVWHLLSRGFSEMGTSKNNSFDQHYITLGEYTSSIYPKTDEERNKAYLHEEEVIKMELNQQPDEIKYKMQLRIIEQASDWARNHGSLRTKFQLRHSK